MKSTLKSDTLLYGGAVMAERLLGLLLLPLLTRRLSAAEYGVWAQSLVVSSVTMPLVVLCLPTAIVRFFSAGVGPAERRKWTGRVLGAFALPFALLASAAWRFRGEVAGSVWGDPGLAGFVPLLLGLLGADALFELLIAHLRSAFRMRRIALLMFARGAVRLGVFGLALDVGQTSFAAAFAAFVALQSVVVASVFALEWRETAPPARPADPPIRWSTLLRFALPLVLLAALGAVNAFADRFVLTQWLGLATLAVYAAAASLVSVTSVAYTVLGFTLFPVLARLWAQGDGPRATELAAGAVRVFLFLALPFVLWFACVAGTVLPLVATAAYRLPGGVVLLMGLAAIGFGLYQIFLYLLLLAGWGLHATGLMALVAALNLGLNLWLVPRHGLTGAATAAAVSNAVLAGLAYLAARARANARFPWGNALRIAGCALLGTLVLASAQRWVVPFAGPALVASLVAAGLVYIGADLLPGASVLRAFAGQRLTAPVGDGSAAAAPRGG